MYLKENNEQYKEMQSYVRSCAEKSMGQVRSYFQLIYIYIYKTNISERCVNTHSTRIYIFAVNELWKHKFFKLPFVNILDFKIHLFEHLSAITIKNIISTKREASVVLPRSTLFFLFVGCCILCSFGQKQKL